MAQHEIKPALVGLADEMRDALRDQLRRHLDTVGEGHSCLVDNCGWGEALLSLNNFELYRSLMGDRHT